MADLYYLANPNTGIPLNFLAEYQTSGATVKYFSNKEEAQFYAESLELPYNSYKVVKKELV